MDRLDILTDRVWYWIDVLEPMGLSHWRIDIEIVDLPDGEASSAAAVRFSPSYDSAWMEFAEEAFFEKSDDEQDEIIVHELLHIVWRDINDAVYEPEYLFGKPAWTAFTSRYDHESEGVIDRTARAIVAAHRAGFSDVVQFEDTEKESN